MATILELSERRGGFFMQYNMASYSSTITFFSFLTLFWLVAAGLSLIFYFLLFWYIGFFLFTCAATTLAIPCSLGEQGLEYEQQITVIERENLEAGQTLTSDQLHTVFRLKNYHEQADHPVIKKDKYGRKLDDGRAKAIQADNYFKVSLIVGSLGMFGCYWCWIL
jgi:hypothetical protein